MAKKTISKKISGLGPKKSKDIPATKSMLDATRAELKADNTSLRLEMQAGFKAHDARFDRIEARFKDVDARFDKVEARFKDVDARFDNVEARFKDVDARFDKVEARFKDVGARFDRLESLIVKNDAKFERSLALLEEQSARNRFVLDGYAHLHLQNENLNSRVEKIEVKLFGKGS